MYFVIATYTAALVALGLMIAAAIGGLPGRGGSPSSSIHSVHAPEDWIVAQNTTIAKEQSTMSNPLKR